MCGDHHRRPRHLIDPGFHTFESGEVDLGSIDVDRVLITHEHRDHVNPEFVRWLIDRRSDLTVYTNSAVAEILDGEGITASTEIPTGVTAEDVLHEPVPTGAQPPNRSFTIEELLHPPRGQPPTGSDRSDTRPSPDRPVDVHHRRGGVRQESRATPGDPHP